MYSKTSRSICVFRGSDREAYVTVSINGRDLQERTSKNSETQHVREKANLWLSRLFLFVSSFASDAK